MRPIPEFSTPNLILIPQNSKYILLKTKFDKKKDMLDRVEWKYFKQLVCHKVQGILNKITYTVITICKKFYLNTCFKSIDKKINKFIKNYKNQRY